MAVALQSRASEVFAVDIHPAAKLGKGVLLDHGTGVVIGETAEVGNNVSILQNVTLGGTGKEHGDRHPKVSDNVLIGASATILGNIRIGKGAQVAAGSLVLKAVPPKTMVAGSPAKEVGRVSGNPALNMEQWNERATKDVIQGGYEATHSSAAEPPCEDIFSEGSAPKAGSNGAGEAVLAAAVEQLSVDAKAEPAAESSTSPAVEDSVQDENAPGDEPAAPARVRGGAPPTVAERVEAVTSDKAAKKKWGKAGKDDMEYMI